MFDQVYQHELRSLEGSSFCHVSPEAHNDFLCGEYVFTNVSQSISFKYRAGRLNCKNCEMESETEVTPKVSVEFKPQVVLEFDSLDSA
ncbi:hypothetical protein GBA52_009040 [Prunus armeniaca]|nr:hypothetical protein GBA52_009040 [Prunus armeniaca]